jgi:hypothetical protein
MHLERFGILSGKPPFTTDEHLGPSDAKEVTVSLLLDPTCRANLEVVRIPTNQVLFEGTLEKPLIIVITVH